MNQVFLVRLAPTFAAVTALAACGCGTNGLGPVAQPPASSSEAGVVALRPSSPSTKAANPIATRGTAPNPYQNLPLEIQEEIAASRTRAEQSRTAEEKAKVALEALKAEQAANAELNRDPSPEEIQEDRRLHPPSQIWSTLSNLKVVPGEFQDTVVSVDYRLACGSPRKFGFYRLYIYVLEPNEIKISEDTKRHERSAPLADKPSGTLTHRIFGGTQGISVDRIVAVMVRGSHNNESLTNRQISGFLTARTPSSDPNPPPLLAALVGAEAQGKRVVLGPFQNRVRRPLITDLDFDIEFQTQAERDPHATYQLVLTSADGKNSTFDITREVFFIEPFTKGMLHLQGGPVLPSRAPARPFRFHVERQGESGDPWEVVSNVITLQ